MIIDEFYGWLRYSFLLTLLDRYPIRIEYKGGSAEFVSRRVIITSNKAPQDWYDQDKFPFPPIERRITKLIWCGENAWLVQK